VVQTKADRPATYDFGPQSAVRLWQQGRDHWNDRMKGSRQPLSVSFQGVDFSQYTGGTDGLVDFTGYHFPTGGVCFDQATFGNRGAVFKEAVFSGFASFLRTNFPNGDVSFNWARFGDGDVSFSRATFGDGDVSFFGANFGDGEVSFSGATFGDGDVSFSGTSFGNGNVSFTGANFGDGDVSFFGANFGDGEVSFSGATFGDGEVSFSGTSFGNGDVWFIESRFGNGDVLFSRAGFGHGDVRFKDVVFADGKVSFDKASFGNGGVSFSGTRFGDGDVSFSGARFGDGDVLFKGATFGDGDVLFNHASFGDGDVSFSGARFGDGDVSFNHASFGDGDVSFERVCFGGGWTVFEFARFNAEAVSFKDADFGPGYVSFERTLFGDTDVLFEGIRLGNGFFSLRDARSGDGRFTLTPAASAKAEWNFQGASFKGPAQINLTQSSKPIEIMTLQGAKFESALFLKGTFDCVPDLRQSKVSHHVDFTQLHTRLARHPATKTRRWRLIHRAGRRLRNVTRLAIAAAQPALASLRRLPWLRPEKLRHTALLIAERFEPLFRSAPRTTPPPVQWLIQQAVFVWQRPALRAADPEDGPRLRRLKEIAEASRDHASALRFAADENRATRWISKGWAASLLDLTFSATSNYGQSVARPVVWLALTLTLAAAGHFILAAGPAAPDALRRAAYSLVLSATHGLTFLPPIKETAGIVTARLFPGGLPLAAIVLSASQSLISFIFLFLIGLGLRNRFRL